MAAKLKPPVCLLEMLIPKSSKKVNQMSSISLHTSGDNSYVFKLLTSTKIVVIINTAPKAFIVLSKQIGAVSCQSRFNNVWLYLADNDSLYTVNITRALVARRSDTGDSSDIFSDLLSDDQNTDSALPSHLKEVRINESHRMIQVNGIIAIQAAADYFIMLLEDALAKSFQLKVYKLTGEENLVIQEMYYCWIHAETSMHSFLPLAEPTPIGHQVEPSRKFHKELQSKQSALLYIVTPRTVQKEKCLQNVYNEEGHEIHISDLLFAQLFGKDILLLGVPVALISSPQGRLYYTPLSSSTSDCAKSLSIIYESHQKLVGCHVVSQDVFESTPSEKPKSDVMVLVGEYGKLVMISAGEIAPVFVESYVPGPILCSLTHGKSVIHSTGKDVWWTNLCVFKTELTESNDINSVPKSCKMSNVCTMASTCSKDEAWFGEDSVSVIMATKSGKVIMTNIEPSSSLHGHWANDRAKQKQGKQIKDLVASINQVSENSEKRKELINICQILCNQLALCGAALSCDDGSGKAGAKLPFDCTASVKQAMSTSHEFHISLVNNSSTMLTWGWYLIVEIKSRSSNFTPCNQTDGREIEILHGKSKLSCAKPDGEASITSHSMSPLSSGASHNVAIGHDANISTDVTVSVYAVFSPGNCWDKLCARKSLTKSSVFTAENNVCLLLLIQQFDIIHFLSQVGSSLPKPLLHTTSIPSSLNALCSLSSDCSPSTLESILHEICRDQCKGTIATDTDCLLNQHNDHSLTVPVVYTDLDQVKSCKDFNKEAAVLDWLFTDNSSFVTSKSQTRVVSMCPAGHKVGIEVRCSPTLTDEIMDLRISSRCPKLTCSLAQAVVARNRFQKRNEPVKKTVSFPSLRKLLCETEEVRSSAEALQDSLLGVNNSADDPHVQEDKVFSVYKKIRNIISSLHKMA